MSLAPSIFIGHGNPMVVLENDSYHDRLRLLAQELSKPGCRPSAIAVISAHWTTGKSLEIAASSKPKQIYDFSGFPKALYEVKYEPPGSPEVARELCEILKAGGFEPILNGSRGLDHGVWVPLKILFPDAEIPVVPISLPNDWEAGELLRLGNVLWLARQKNIMILGSGDLVHNLGRVSWNDPRGISPEWVSQFESWILDKVQKRDLNALLRYDEQAPHAQLAHPTAEHIQPLFPVLGAGGQDPVRIVFQGFHYGSISMTCLAFGA